MAANMGQMFTGLNYGGRGVSGIMPATPATNINVQASGGLGVQSGTPLGMLLLLAIGGLTVLYFGTRTIQGIR